MYRIRRDIMRLNTMMLLRTIFLKYVMMDFELMRLQRDGCGSRSL